MLSTTVTVARLVAVPSAIASLVAVRVLIISLAESTINLLCALSVLPSDKLAVMTGFSATVSVKLTVALPVASVF